MNEFGYKPEGAEDFIAEPNKKKSITGQEKPAKNISRIRRALGTVALLGVSAFNPDVAKAQVPEQPQVSGPSLAGKSSRGHETRGFENYQELTSRLEGNFQKLAPREVRDLLKEDKESVFFIVGNGKSRGYFKDTPSESSSISAGTSLKARKEIGNLASGHSVIDYFAHGHTHPERKGFPHQTMNPPSQADLSIALRNAEQFQRIGVKSEEMVLDRGGIWQIDVSKDSPLLSGMAEFDRLKGEFYLSLKQAGLEAEANWVYKRIDRMFGEREIQYLEHEPDQRSKNFAVRLRAFMRDNPKMGSFLKSMDEINTAVDSLNDQAGQDQTLRPGQISDRMQVGIQSLKETALRQGMGINYQPFADR